MVLISVVPYYSQGVNLVIKFIKSLLNAAYYIAVENGSLLKSLVCPLQYDLRQVISSLMALLTYAHTFHRPDVVPDFSYRLSHLILTNKPL